jgi:glycosyltransferase involved in cell wall biosynthesis
MHVLITTDTVGGVWTYARELVTGLARRGVEVTLVSFGDVPTPQQMLWLDSLPNVNFHPTAFRLEWMQDVEEDLAASAEYLERLIDDAKPDMLHLNQFYYGALQTRLPKLVVGHSDVVSWWVAVHGEEPRETKWLRWYRQVVTQGLQRADAVATPSQWMLDALECHYGALPPATVVHNGRSPTLFNPHVSKDDYVMSVGRLWDAGKQVSLLAQEELPVSVIIAGPEEHPGGVAHPDKMSGTVRPKLHFRGTQNEVQLRLLYSRAAIYAATSRYEPFGLAPLEAALSRCAIIANDIPSFHEVWGENAIYFRHNDAHSLGEQVMQLHRDPELRRTYANFAYQHALKNFTCDRMVDEYLSLYQSLVPAQTMVA